MFSLDWSTNFLLSGKWLVASDRETRGQDVQPIYLGHTKPQQDAALLRQLEALACPQCGHPVLMRTQDGERCEKCGWLRIEKPPEIPTDC